MRSLFISCLFPSEATGHSGVFVKEHAIATQKAGTEVQVLALHCIQSSASLSITYKTVVVDGVVIHHHFLRSKYSKHFFNLPWLRLKMAETIVAQIIADFKPEIVHGNFIHPAGVMAYLIGKRYKLPYVISEHWSGIDLHMRKHPFSYLSKRAYEQAASILPVSEALANTIRQYISHNRIEALPNVVEIANITEAKNYEPDKAKLNLLSVMNLSSPKRLDICIEALGLYYTTHSNEGAIFKVVGDGPLREDFKAVAEKYLSLINLKIEFLGKQSKESISGLLSETDYFLHCSDYETFGVVIAEALALGVPVLASEVGGVTEVLVSKADGLLVQNSVEEWVSAYRELIDTAFDRVKIQQENRNRFTALEIGKKIQLIYNRILA